MCSSPVCTCTQQTHNKHITNTPTWMAILCLRVMHLHTTNTQQTHNKRTTNTQQTHNKHTTNTQQTHRPGWQSCVWGSCWRCCKDRGSWGSQALRTPWAAWAWVSGTPPPWRWCWGAPAGLRLTPKWYVCMWVWYGVCLSVCVYVCVCVCTIWVWYTCMCVWCSCMLSSTATSANMELHTCS